MVGGGGRDAFQRVVAVVEADVVSCLCSGFRVLGCCLGKLSLLFLVVVLFFRFSAYFHAQLAPVSTPIFKLGTCGWLVRY